MNIRKLTTLYKKLSHAFGQQTKIKMSALSPTMEAGTIAEWMVKEGQKISEEQDLALIETDKAKVKLQSPEAGYIAKLMFPENAKDIPVGEVIAYLVEDEADLKNFVPEGARPAEPAKQTQAQAKPVSQAPPKQAGPKKSYPPHMIIKMPSLSPTKDGGKIKEWNVKVGDKVDPDTSIASVETDKSTLDFKITEDGYIAKILVRDPEEDIPGNTPVFVLAENKSDIDAFKDFTVGESQETQTGSEESAPQTSAPKQSQTNTQIQQPIGSKVFASPKARKLAHEKNIDLNQVNIQGTGPNNRIIAENVLSYTPTQQPVREQPQQQTEVQAEKKKAPAPQTEMATGLFEEINPSNVRKVIAQRLSQSKREIPHYYLNANIEMGNLLAFKAKIFTETQKKVSVNDFIIRACALACQDVPEVNSQWINDKIRKFKDTDISFAVDTGNGLITPIVKQANHKSLSAIGAEVLSLVDRARKGELQPNDYIVH
jgi:pyruvate dehydrogenase E2 component (dihydrolipoamide acetyltransferase)